MDQEAIKGAMDITSDESGSKLWIREQAINQRAKK